MIALFESPSKTLLRVLFSSLYLQILIFYHGILDLQWCGRRSCWSLFNKRISLTSFEFGTNVAAVPLSSNSHGIDWKSRISISGSTVSSRWANPNRKYNFKTSKQWDGCIVWLWECQQSILQVKCTYTREFHIIPATGDPDNHNSSSYTCHYAGPISQ